MELNSDTRKVYRAKFIANIEEAQIHLNRLYQAFEKLKEHFKFPIDEENFKKIENDFQLLAYCDQVIYRFSKLQDTIGAKLFKSFLLYQGETTNKPFLDILNYFEKLDILEVDEWFKLRDFRNSIAHDYENSSNENIDIINLIYIYKPKLETILNRMTKYLQ